MREQDVFRPRHPNWLLSKISPYDQVEQHCSAGRGSAHSLAVQQHLDGMLH